MKMSSAKDWPNRGKGAVPTQIINQDHEMRYTKADIIEKSRSPDWEAKKDPKKKEPKKK